MWDLIGVLQFDMMLGAGLKPEHRLLDVGCGCFRGGLRFLAYLDDGNYVGLDRDAALVEAGMRVEIPKAGLCEKKVTTVINADFDLSGYENSFDYALAQSVFTHLRRDQIGECLTSVRTALKPGGRFYASYFHAPRSRYFPPITHQPGGVVTHLMTDPFHQSTEFYEGLADELRMGFRRIGEWGHPRSQKLLEFSKPNGRSRE
jgi:cyclopropane fatty-acyl-phospholipid synthase-like methyltransferase